MNQISPVLEHREHDHARCAALALGHAEEICDREGLRFTPQRRQVLEALLLEPRAGLRLRRHRPAGRERGPPPGADLGLPRARFPGGAQPRPPHRIRRTPTSPATVATRASRAPRSSSSATIAALPARRRRRRSAAWSAPRPAPAISCRASTCWKCAASAPAAGRRDDALLSTSTPNPPLEGRVKREGVSPGSNCRVRCSCRSPDVPLPAEIRWREFPTSRARGEVRWSGFSHDRPPAPPPNRPRHGRRRAGRRRRAGGRPVDDQHRHRRCCRDRGAGGGARRAPARSWCASPSTATRRRPPCRTSATRSPSAASMCRSSATSTTSATSC